VFDQTDPKSHGELVAYQRIEEPDAYDPYLPTQSNPH
jgi:hypothetical protein